MKKIVLAVMAVAAIGFTASCGNKTQQADAVDSVAIVDSLAGEAANATISALTEQLEAKDANKLQETLATIKEKIASLIKENPEVAKEYVAKVQSFLKENADKIKEVAGENGAIAAAVSAVTSIEPANIVSGFLNALLRRYAREGRTILPSSEREILSVKANLPVWLVERYIRVRLAPAATGVQFSKS